MRTHNYKRAYVWEWPIRLFHWVNAASITVLIITGLVIANPPAVMTGNEASHVYWFGYVRMVHFIAAYALIAILILRVYWAFKGNKFANYKAFFPFNKEGFKKMWHVIKFDIFLQNEKQYHLKNIAVGHNSIAVISYLGMFVLALIMIATGMALYEPNATWFLPKMFRWVTPLLGGDINVRIVHHSIMWIFVLFIIGHVYLVFYHDWLEGRGEASAMISGFKFVRSERVDGSEKQKTALDAD